MFHVGILGHNAEVGRRSFLIYPQNVGSHSEGFWQRLGGRLLSHIQGYILGQNNVLHCIYLRSLLHCREICRQFCPEIRVSFQKSVQYVSWPTRLVSTRKLRERGYQAKHHQLDENQIRLTSSLENTCWHEVICGKNITFFLFTPVRLPRT